MTKRQLIEALERCTLPDDTEVLKSRWEAPEDCTGFDVEQEINEICEATKLESRYRRASKEHPVIIL